MSPSNTSPGNNKVMLFALFALLLGVAGTAAILFYLGLFNNVTLRSTLAPAYRLAYLDHTGAYDKIHTTMDKAEELLRETGITPIAPCAIYLDDPSVVPTEQLRGKAGFLIPATGTLPGNLKIEEIPPRQIIQAKFSGSPVIGSYKAYPAMKHWAGENGYTLNLPSMEIYHDGEVEYQLPITPRTQ